MVLVGHTTGEPCCFQAPTIFFGCELSGGGLRIEGFGSVLWFRASGLGSDVWFRVEGSTSTRAHLPRRVEGLTFMMWGLGINRSRGGSPTRARLQHMCSRKGFGVLGSGVQGLWIRVWG